MKLTHHNDFEIYYLLDGRRNILFKMYSVVKGDIVLINIKTSIKLTNNSVQRIVINFKKEFIAPLLEDEDDLLVVF